MKPHSKPITAKIVVTDQSSAGIAARVNGQATHFRDRDALFRAAVLLAGTEIRAKRIHPPPIEGV
jgi:hypothetical protein